MSEEMKVGITRKRGCCFRCQNIKEVVLFSRLSCGAGDIAEEAERNGVAAGERWVCDDCFRAAVSGRHRTFYM